ncbi:hypothetical protein [Zavarzinia compransoris]|uniref:Uncharacterized protein n=1 Tax=Zavarzinia compransoris TaxID=1264899 RepID=A0A317DYH6_9PROT|nr:hypothetical protein [Zavarzinia compransoris]PWR18906.1 hypothetical protein DKG75_18205 [Zavarzinia compransoris]TDP48902.1 hypothetical protein DES42_101262 [Zavarzinia compransoris]
MVSRRDFLIAVPAAGLAACAGRDPAPSFPPFHVGGSPLLFNLAEVEVRNLSTALGQGHVEADFDVPPLTALENWVGDRIQAAGASGRLIVNVREASAVQERLATTGGVEGLFRSEQGYKVTVRLVVEFVAEDPSRLVGGRTTVAVDQFKTMAEDVSFTERRQTNYALSRTLIEAFDAKAVPSLRQFLGPFLG